MRAPSHEFVTAFSHVHSVVHFYSLSLCARKDILTATEQKAAHTKNSRSLPKPQEDHTVLQLETTDTMRTHLCCL